MVSRSDGDPPRQSRPRRGQGEGDVYPFKRDAAGKVVRWAASVEVGWLDGKRKRKVVTAPTKRGAQLLAAELRRQKDEGHSLAPDRETVGQYLDRWLRDVIVPNREDRTADGYRSIIEHHLKPTIGRIPLTKLTPEEVQALYAARRKTHSPGTVRNIHSCLHAALQLAVKSRRLRFNPAEHVDKPRRTRYKPAVLTGEEAERLLATAAAEDHRLYALFALVLTTGIRESEAFGLRWRDLDVEAGRAALQQTASRRRRNGPFGSTKSHRSDRPVAVIPLAATALEAHRRRQKEEQKAAGPAWTEHGLVFTTRVGTPLDGSNFTARDWKPLLRRAGLHPDVRFHDLRHSAATFLLKKKVPLKVVSELLGHSSIGITGDLYSHVAESLVDEAATAMSEVFGSTHGSTGREKSEGPAAE